MGKCARGKPPSQPFRDCAALLSDFGYYGFVIGMIDYDDYVLMVLCSRADHSRTAYINIFDDLFECRVGTLGSLAKRIEVDRYEIDAAYRMALEGLHMIRVVSSSKQSAVNLRMERLHAAVEHLWKTGDRRYVLRLDSAFS